VRLHENALLVDERQLQVMLCSLLPAIHRGTFFLCVRLFEIIYISRMFYKTKINGLCHSWNSKWQTMIWQKGLPLLKTYSCITGSKLIMAV
jgi:hypothetical protein